MIIYYYGNYIHDDGIHVKHSIYSERASRAGRIYKLWGEVARAGGEAVRARVSRGQKVTVDFSEFSAILLTPVNWYLLHMQRFNSQLRLILIKRSEIRTQSRKRLDAFNEEYKEVQKIEAYASTGGIRAAQ